MLAEVCRGRSGGCCIIMQPGLECLLPHVGLMGRGSKGVRSALQLQCVCNRGGFCSEGLVRSGLVRFCAEPCRVQQFVGAVTFNRVVTNTATVRQRHVE